MRREPSTSRSMHGEKDFHGCMRGVLHLFDFNQALTSRKILPGQKFCDELEDSRKSFDVPSKLMKHDNEEKKRTPNVVARLMGLDIMPNDSSKVDQSAGSSTSAKNTLTICPDKKQQNRPPTFLKSRSVHILNDISSSLSHNVVSEGKKLQFGSRSFREHPQEKQLEEFKREFEASQYRDHPQYLQHENLKFRQDNVEEKANQFLFRDKFTDSKRTPAQERHNQSKEFLDALDYLQKNEEVFLKALHNPNPLLPRRTCPSRSEDTDKVSAQEFMPKSNTKELASPPFTGSKMQKETLLPLNSRSNLPSKNLSGLLPATIVILKPNPGNVTHTNMQSKNYNVEVKQSRKDTSKDLGNKKEIARENLKRLTVSSTKKVSKQVDLHEDCNSISSSRRKMPPLITSSSKELSINGGEVPSAPKKLSNRTAKNSPRLQSSSKLGTSVEVRSEEEKNVSVKKEAQCQRGSKERKVSSRTCHAPWVDREVNVNDRIASAAFSSNCATAESAKKTNSQNLIVKGKTSSRKGPSSLSKGKDRKIDPGTKVGNAQVAVGNPLVVDAEVDIQTIFKECPTDNTLHGTCEQPCGEVADGVDEKCEHPSPVSVLDGPFQQESPSPIKLKDTATDFHELRTKLCLLKQNRDDLRDSDQDGQVHHVEDMASQVENIQVESSLAAQEEMAASKSLCSFKMQSSQFESLGIEGIPYPEGKEANLLYVRNVFVSAGFSNDNILAFTRWYSPAHPIDPHVFDQLENYYHELKAVNPCKNSGSESCQACVKSNVWLDELHRKLMFELVDEIVGQKIKPYLNTRAWINPVKPNLRYMSTGKQLLSEVWNEICTCPEADCEILEDVEALVAGDMVKEAPWAGDSEDIEKVGFELEQQIFSYLLEELVLDFLSV
eukprot:Gb_38190 [translate_table: standard]